MKLQNVADMVKWRMCLGCGACLWACKQGKIRLYDFLDEGLRPVVEGDNCGSCRNCLNVCPVFNCEYLNTSITSNKSFNLGFQKKWGPIIKLWEGYAVDPEIRFKGASGGVLTALSAYCLEKGRVYGILHTGADPENPIRNRTRLSRTREQLLISCGSRYSPASVCNGIGILERADGPCVLIGRPVEIAAFKNALKLSPSLEKKVGLTMSFFCAETPSTRGTLALLSKIGVNVEDLKRLRYRGYGWPGDFVVMMKNESKPLAKISYRESWGFLQAYRPWSCQLWPDGGGELADITCGDPWYREPDGKDPGSSLVLTRSLRGKEIIEGAIEAGYLKLEPAEDWKLEKSQWGLIQKKGSVWGRRLALRLMGLPVTNLKGLSLFHCWLQISQEEKVKSILGTVRRVIERHLYRPLEIHNMDHRPVPTPLIELAGYSS